MIRTYRLFKVSQSVKSIVEIRKGIIFFLEIKIIIEAGDFKLLDTI